MTDVSTNALKTRIQTAIESQFNEWAEINNPKRVEGKKARNKLLDFSQEFIWTTSESFEHEYLLLDNGEEISCEAITIIPGVADGDQYWICEESWETRYVEGSMIFIEVVVSCTSCKRGIEAPQRDCLDCDGAGEWVFLPSNLTRNF